MIHTVKGFGVVSKAELDVFFRNFLAFFNDPVDVGNLISGSSAFSKSSLNIWKFMVYILLKPGLENFDHYKKVGKTTRPFMYDLNQIPYDYIVEVTNRFKGLYLIECLKNYGWRFVTLYRRQGSRPSPRKRNAKRQYACPRRPYK